MSVLERQEKGNYIDLHRWPALSTPRSAPIRTAVARKILARVATRSGVRVEFPLGPSYGPAGGPVMNVREPRAFLARLGRDGKIGFGESYMAREWESDDLFDVLLALARHAETLIPPPLQRLRRWYESRRPGYEDNDRVGAARNISRHYDLSNELFAAFLDETMSYSGAIFPRDEISLEEAQIYKINRLLNATNVQRGCRVLEIGTGWGELALRAARRGAHVTSVTLSREQAKVARQRVTDAGLDDLVDIRVQDYRDVEGLYDVVVSVEMIEAVGEKWWPTYFSTLQQRLVRGGRIGLQSILMAHDRLEATKRSWTWIHKYIFPGGIIPSEIAIREALRAHTDLEVVDGFRFGASYATTLRQWRERFGAAAPDVAALGFDDTFCRMWEFYLTYCESGFESGYLDVAQFVLAHRQTTTREEREH